MSEWEHAGLVGGMAFVVLLGLIILVVIRTRGWEKRE